MSPFRRVEVYLKDVLWYTSSAYGVYNLSLFKDLKYTSIPSFLCAFSSRNWYTSILLLVYLDSILCKSRYTLMPFGFLVVYLEFT